MGDNGTYTAIVEGTFDIHFDKKITTVTVTQGDNNIIIIYTSNKI